MKNVLFFLLLILSCSTGNDRSIEISDAWIREAPVNSDITALYFDIQNSGSSEDRVVSINTPISDSAEIHNTIIDSRGIAKMVRLEEVKIASNNSLKFAPGGMHVMLIGLNKEIRAGEEYQININFKNSGTKTVTAKVKGLYGVKNRHKNN